jgi:hypothetical protein
MDNEDERIWNHAQGYKVESGEQRKFARFLFVDVEEIPSEVENMLTETDRNVLNLPYMRDNGRVFDVVYDQMEDEMGEVEVEETDRFLVFKPRN